MSKIKQKLKTGLEAVAWKLSREGETHVKAYEVAFQDVIETVFKGKCWWEVTTCKIWDSLVGCEKIEEVIQCILDGIKDETVTEMLHENDVIDFTIPAEYMNDPKSVDFKSIMAKRRAEHEQQKAEEDAAKRKEELRAKYADLLNKVAEADDKHQVLFDALVPGQGACDTVAGELIRAINRILYRDSNDGDVFYEGYGLETCGAAAAYLSDHGFEEDIIRIAEMGLQDDSYTKAIEQLDAKVVQSVIDNPELLETELDYDMWDTEWEWLKEYQPRYEFEYSVSDKVEAYIDAGHVTSWDLVQVVEEWLQYDSRFEGAEVSRPWGHRDTSVTIENLTKDGLEACEEWNSWNMWEDYENDLQEEYGDLSEEDDEDDEDDNEEYDESLKESTWAEHERSFTKVTMDKLQKIHESGLWDEFSTTVDDNELTCNTITGVFTDMYRTARPEYSSYTAEDIQAGRKELFRIINDFYKKALAAESEHLTEEVDGLFNPIAYLKDMPKWDAAKDGGFAKNLVGDLARVFVDDKYIKLEAPSSEYINGGIINVTEKFIETLEGYVENKYDGWTIGYNNTATTFWFIHKG